MKMDEREIRLRNGRKMTDIALKGKWTDIDRLKYMMYGIQPYSRYWRWGMIRALKHAIKLMEKEQKEKEE